MIVRVSRQVVVRKRSGDRNGELEIVMVAMVKGW